MTLEFLTATHCCPRVLQVVLCGHFSNLKDQQYRMQTLKSRTHTQVFDRTAARQSVVKQVRPVTIFCDQRTFGALPSLVSGLSLANFRLMSPERYRSAHSSGGVCFPSSACVPATYRPAGRYRGPARAGGISPRRSWCPAPRPALPGIQPPSMRWGVPRLSPRGAATLRWPSSRATSTPIRPSRTQIAVMVSVRLRRAGLNSTVPSLSMVRRIGRPHHVCPAWDCASRTSFSCCFRRAVSFRPGTTRLTCRPRCRTYLPAAWPLTPSSVPICFQVWPHGRRLRAAAILWPSSLSASSETSVRNRPAARTAASSGVAAKSVCSELVCTHEAMALSSCSVWSTRFSRALG